MNRFNYYSHGDIMRERVIYLNPVDNTVRVRFPYAPPSWALKCLKSRKFEFNGTEWFRSIDAFYCSPDTMVLKLALYLNAVVIALPPFREMLSRLAVANTDINVYRTDDGMEYERITTGVFNG